MSSSDEIATTLIEQVKRREIFSPTLRDGEPLDLDIAYDVQDRYLAAMRAPDESVIGYKIGLTSAVMQRFCGVDEPIMGSILSRDLHRGGDTLYRADYVRLGLECEMALRLTDDLPRLTGQESPEQLLPYVASVHPAFEVIDDRGADYAALDAPSILIGNSWNRGIVVGEGRMPDGLGMLDGVDGRLSVNREDSAHGSSRDVLGSPLNVLAWLNSFLARRGRALAGGEWVLTGSIIATRFPEAADLYRFELADIGAVEVHIV